MAQVGKENKQDALLLPELARKESVVLTANALSSSKIPVLAKSRLPPELKQSQQRQSCLQQACASSGRNKAIKNPKVPHTGSAPGAGGLEPVAALLPKSLSREPLGEVQLSTSGHRNEGSASDGKSTDHNGRGGGSTVEFVPDVAALASILSNTGLTNHMVSATHKPSLARRVPLRGNRACSASIGTARGSRYIKVPEGNPVRFSCISRSTPKDTDHLQPCSLPLNTQQLKTLSTSLKNLGPRVEAAKPRQTTQDLGNGKSEDPAAKRSTECLSRITQTGVPVQSNSAGTEEAVGSSWRDEEFVPDPAAKASILSNEGLSRFALGANGKLSLAQRVPVKDTRKPPVSCSSTRGESGFFLEPHTRVSSVGKFGRVSCRSAQGPKGLKKLEAYGAQLTNTPGNRCFAVDCSPYRRVPITCPQSSVCTPDKRSSPWTFSRVPLSSGRMDRRVDTQHPTETEQVKLTGSVTPQMGTASSKQDDTAVPWEKIAVRLFDDELAASGKKEPAVPVITPEMGKLQCIELLAQFLQQEMNNGGVDHDVAPSLEELHKLLSAHCSPALAPGHLSTPSQDPRPNFCIPTPLHTVVGAPETSTKLITTSSQSPICPSSSVNLAQPLSSSASNSGQVKQRLDDLLNAPQRFHEACLNDECAFYTARIMSVSQRSVQRCKEPVAKTLAAHDAMHFIPISAPLSPLEKGERPSSS